MYKVWPSFQLNKHVVQCNQLGPFLSDNGCSWLKCLISSISFSLSSQSPVWKAQPECWSLIRRETGNDPFIDRLPFLPAHFTILLSFKRVHFESTSKYHVILKDNGVFLGARGHQCPARSYRYSFNQFMMYKNLISNGRLNATGKESKFK